MSIIIRLGTIFTVALLLLTPILPAFAQGEDTTLPEDILILLEQDPDTLTPEEVNRVLPYLRPGMTPTTTTPTPENVVPCFDYYTFGSVLVTLSPSVTSAVSGSAITFTGTVKNDNPYPIVNGQVYVKVFQLTEFADGEKINGYPVVDQFVALDGVAIPAGGEVPVSFAWQIPAYAQSGDYELNTFFMTEERFNLLGLPFTDDVTGTKIDFSVIGEVASGVALDKQSVTLNDEPFYFAAYPPHVGSTTSVLVSADVVNDTDDTVTIPVTFTLYNWAGERVESQLDTTTSQVTLAPGERQSVSYTATKATGAVSFVRIESSYQDTTSILNVRFVRDDIEEIRLNFPSSYTYPLTAGSEATIFSCLHSTNVPYVDNSTLTLTLTDTNGAVIHSYTYEGGVTGDMMGVKSAFTPADSYTDFDLTATLIHNGTVVEEVVIPYRCAEIDSSLCPATPTASDSLLGGKLLLSLVVVVGLLVLLLVLIQRRTNKASPLLMLAIALVIPLTLFAGLFAPTAVEAKSVTVTAGGVPQLFYVYNYAPVYSTDTVPLLTDPTAPTDPRYSQHSLGVGWTPGLQSGATTQVTYKARLVNNASGDVITDGTSVPVGTVLRLEQLSTQGTDISWVGTGQSGDSPYGHWVAEAGPLPNACRTEDFVNRAYSFDRPGNPAWDVYILFNVNPPTPTVTTSSNLSCTGTTCTVTAAGPITATMNFPQTYGRFYYRYFDDASVYHDNGGCHANNVPMGYALVGPEAWFWGAAALSAATTYTHPIPATTISFTANAVASSQPPTAPTITPESTNTYLTTSAQSFSLLATDPDNDTIRYGIDWDLNGSVDEWVPGTGYVPSGASQTSNRTWATIGTKSFQVLAADSNGATSPYTPHTLTINAPPAVATLGATGCTIALNQSSCSGSATWSITNGTSPFRLSNTTTGSTISTAVSGSGVSLPLPYGTYTITLSHDAGVTLITRTVSATCNNSIHQWNGTACVPLPEVVAPPTITLEATPAVVRRNNTSTISWTIDDLTGYTCTLSGPGLATTITTTTGSETTNPLTSKANITMTCTNGTDSSAQTVSVEVVPTVEEV